jgi:ATP synthase protein I
MLSKMTNPGRNRDRPPGFVALAARYFALGMEMAFSVLVGFGVGHLLDRELHTAPWLTLLFCLLGIIAAYMDVYHAVRAFRQDGPGEKP